MTRRSQAFALTVIVAAFAVAASWGIRGGLPYVHFSNEAEQVSFALKFSSGDLNPHRFVHPPLLAYVLCVGYGVTFLLGRLFGAYASAADFEKLFFTDPTLFFLIARYFILMMGIGSLIVFYRLSRDIYGRVAVALLAVALLATSATHVAIAHYGTPDIFMMFLALLSFLPIMRVLRGEGTMRHYVLAGVLSGLAVAAKYNAFCVAAALPLAHFLGFSWGTSGWKEALSSRKLWVGMFLVWGGFFLGNPFFLLDFKTFLADYQYLKDVTRSPDYLFAHLRADNHGAVYLLGRFFPTILGAPLAAMCYVGVLHALIRRRKQDMLLAAYVIGYSAFIAPHKIFKPYYFVHVLPFMFLLASKTCVMAADRVVNKRFRPALLGSLLVVLAAHPLSLIFRFDLDAAAPSALNQAKDWVEKNVIVGTGVAIFEGMPLNPNRVSLERQILETDTRGFGAGVRLRRLLRHSETMAATYDVYEFPDPWRADFHPAKFDYQALRKAGVRYVILSNEWERYNGDPSRYPAQAALYRKVVDDCRQDARFEQNAPDVDLGILGQMPTVYIEIFDCRRG